MKQHLHQTRSYGDFSASNPRYAYLEEIPTYKARVESTRKAHIMPPIDSAKAFGDPPCMIAVGATNPTEVLLFPLLSPVGDRNVVVAFVATLQLALDVDGAVDIDGALGVDEVVYVGGGVYPNGGAG
jgi:hypothetical protein